MKKLDFVWFAAVVGIALLLSVPVTHDPIMAGTRQHPLIAGFIKFFILATLGDLLAIRITGGEWLKPVGLIYRSIVWGVFGIVIALAFEVYSNGVTAAMSKGLLSGQPGTLMWAFLVSGVMNLTFGPILMMTHRFADTFIDLTEGKISDFGSISFSKLIGHIDCQGLIQFTIKIQLYLWLPAHTIVFLLPAEYRVLAAAGMSILMGAVLSFVKNKNANEQVGINYQEQAEYTKV